MFFTASSEKLTSKEDGTDNLQSPEISQFPCKIEESAVLFISSMEVALFALMRDNGRFRLSDERWSELKSFFRFNRKVLMLISHSDPRQNRD
jgi:hypothetical protein